MLVGLVPVVVAGAGRRRASARSAAAGSSPLGVAAAVVARDRRRRGDARRRPAVDRRLLGALGAGLDVAAVVARRRRRSARCCGRGWPARSARSPSSPAWRRRRRSASPATRPASRGSCRRCRRCRCRRSRSSASRGETVLLALALGPLVAGGLLVWTLLGASIDERRRCAGWRCACVTGVGVVAVMQLVRLLGLVDVGDGFLAALPRAVAWAAVAAGVGGDRSSSPSSATRPSPCARWPSASASCRSSAPPAGSPGSPPTPRPRTSCPARRPRRRC